MKEELIKFVLENNLSPFSPSKSLIKNGESIYKTRDAKSIHTKVLSKISSEFSFSETPNIWNFFPFTSEIEEIIERQEFFKTIQKKDKDFLEKISKPRQTWSPQYGIIAVTEDESTFVRLKDLSCPVQLILSESDILDLENYDIVQVIDCESYGNIIEKLPQSVFMESVENIYLERYLEELSGWKENLEILKDVELSEEIKPIIEQLCSLFELIDTKARKTLTVEETERVLEDINEKLSEKIKEMTISGDSLLKILGEGKMPPEFLKIIEDTIEGGGLPQTIFTLKIPVEIDYPELESQIKRQNANEFTNLAEEVKRKAEELKQIPDLLKKLAASLLVEDFCLGIANRISEEAQFPNHSEELRLSNAKNLFLTNAQPVSFQLDNFYRCSILTGANSGGKTTLIEHIIQNISLFQLGLPIVGEVNLPLFSDIYYFAKNKGSASKGAFETLLTQMSKIKPGIHTLILADEIEAVTEPGVAGKIISATAEYFIKQNCFLVIATHLGYEIKKTLPERCRMDGIEAKGLDENFNLIVDHNPVLGRLAHSTPELIVKRMANAHKGDYFEFLHENLKKE
jgi:DNA mismatch repair protein MutS2